MNLKQACKRMDDAQQAATQAVDAKQQEVGGPMSPCPDCGLYNRVGEPCGSRYCQSEQLKQQPSERPWRKSSGWGMHIVDAHGNNVGWRPVKSADTELVLTVVNSHAALVEALRQIAYHPHSSYEVSTVQIADGHRCAAAIARAALALAAGEVGEG